MIVISAGINSTCNNALNVGDRCNPCDSTSPNKKCDNTTKKCKKA